MSAARGHTGNSDWLQICNWRRYGERRRTEIALSRRAMFAAAAAGARIWSRLLTATCTFKAEGDEDLRMEIMRGRPNVIWLMWHNRLPAFFTYCDLMARRNPLLPVASIISASLDGELLARPLREIGGLEIRGSSSSKAAVALRAAVDAARAGISIATVGDGPRGPRYELKPGPILLAKATGFPIVLSTWSASRAGQIHRSWDQMMFPLPYSCVTLHFDKPFHVPPNADADSIARLRRVLESRLMELTQQADAATCIALQLPRPKPGELLKRRKAQALAERRR